MESSEIKPPPTLKQQLKSRNTVLKDYFSVQGRQRPLTSASSLHTQLTSSHHQLLTTAHPS